MATTKKTTTGKTTTTTRKAADPAKSKAETFEQRKQRLEDKRRREAEARIAAANEDLDNLAGSITQREWLLICRRLDMTRDKIADDRGLRLLALAWVRQQREHGGADWDRLLNMTDEEVAAQLGYDSEGYRLDKDGNRIDPAEPES